jgi:hypothetical protein
MDSASPIAQRTAGQTSLDTGTMFTFAMWTNKAGNVPIRPNALDTPDTLDTSRGYRDDHRRPHGEGRLA